MNATQWAWTLGFALPALVAFVNRETWKPQVKAAVALVSSLVIGTGNVLFSGQHLTLHNWAASVGIVGGASIAAYKLFWSGSGISDWIEKNVNIISGKPASGNQPPAAPTA